MKEILFILILLLSISHNSYGQTKKIPLVSFKNESISKVMNEILTTKSNCKINRKIHKWYIEQKTEDSFIISISRVGNLLQSLFDEKKLYVTLLKGNVIFIKANENNNLLEKTSFNVDVSKYINDDFVMFEDFSSWLIKKDGKSKEFQIFKRNIFKCK
jgi:hypothetical protein